MSVRHLQSFRSPASVAVFGATERPGAIGSVVMRNILAGGFGGRVYGVNPKLSSAHGTPCYADAASLPEAPELAVIATPFDTAAAIVDTLGARGTRAVVVISAAMGDAEAVNAAKTALLAAAERHGVRMVGPNCLGIMAPLAGLNATFSHLGAAPGRLAFVAQSGAIVTAMMDWADSRGVGFSQVVSLGDMADVDLGDLLDFLADDPKTDAILLYIEGVTSARKFVSAARAAARSKPVLVVKGGRFAAGARAAATHTGAMMGSDAVYEAVFRRTGLLRVDTLEELFDAAESLSRIPRLQGERLAIVTNGGGMAVLAADALAGLCGTLATLSSDTLAALDAMLPRNWSRTNPVDVIGDAHPERLAKATAIVAADPGVDAVLLIHCPTAVCPAQDAAAAVTRALASRGRTALLCSWVGGTRAEQASRLCEQAGIPAFPTPEQGVRAFMHAVAYRRSRETLDQTPEPLPEIGMPAVQAWRLRLQQRVAEGHQWLPVAEARALLAENGFEVLQTETATDAAGAGAIAARLGCPVALKIRSPDVPHKTDVGGVVLDLQGSGATAAAALAMAEGIRARLPQARLEGFEVEPMVPRRGAQELLLGMSSDPQFGPVLVFGQGGTATETIDDRSLALPPLNLQLARDMVAGTRISRLLAGARGIPAVDTDAVALALVRLSGLICEIPEIRELDINPLLARADGAVALDVRVRIAAATGEPHARLSIRPYPRELEEEIRLQDGRSLWLRPVRPEDEPAMRRAFDTLTPEEIYLRFFAPLKTLSHAMAARFTQIDYDRQISLILTTHGAPGTTEFLGAVSLDCDADLRGGDFSILVHHTIAGQGLGQHLMQRIISWGRSRGLREITGEVLAHNATMLDLCRRLGFRLETRAHDAAVLHARLTLAEKVPG